MKRDLDLVRKILFVMEEDEFHTTVDAERIPKIEGYNELQIFYHMKIMVQAGLIHVDTIEIPVASDQKITYYNYSISWNGHEFLDAARDETRWKKAKGTMVKTGGFVLPVLMQLLTSYLKAELKLP